jgi:hypothetical protein
LTELASKLDKAITEGQAFGPEDRPLQSVSAADLREALLSFDSDMPRRGALRLRHLHITGPLDLSGCDIPVPLQLHGCRFDAAVNLGLSSIRDLALESCVCEGPFAAPQMTIDRNLLLTSCRFELGMLITEARCEGNVRFDNSTFSALTTGQPAIVADSVRTGGDLSFESVAAHAETRVIGARIEGQLVLVSAKLEATEGSEDVSAFSGDRLYVREGVFCEEVESDGDFRLNNAVIDGQLRLDRAKLTSRRDGDGAMTGFTADGLRVRHDAYFTNATVTGECRLLGASIGGQLSMEGTTLNGRVGRSGTLISLGADLLKLGENVYLIDGFTANGKITMVGAQIPGVLTMEVASVSAGKSVVAVSLRHSTIFELRVPYSSIDGDLDLRGATITTLCDAPDGKLDPHDNAKLRLENLSYQFLDQPLDAKRRLPWVEAAQDSAYSPGVYLQLAAAFERIGHRGDSRQVRIASEKKAIEQMAKWRPRWLWNKLLWITTGSGHRNWLAALWLIGLVSVGAFVFWQMESSFSQLSPDPPKFNPILYSIDATVPVLEVGQQRSWSAGNWVRWACLFLTIAGYVLVTAVVAAGATLINRDNQ